MTPVELVGNIRKFGILLLYSFCGRDGELQWKKKAVRSQSGESTNMVRKSIIVIVAYYCSVIRATGFSGFIIQLLMVILGVAILVTSFFCLYIEMIHKLEGWKTS